MRKILAILILIFTVSACSKPNLVQMQRSPQLSAVFKGKLWWKLKVIQNGKERINGGYASFVAGKDFLIVNLRSPFNFKLATIFWKRDNPNRIDVIDYFHERRIVFLFTNKKLPLLPYYFLGLLETKKRFKLFKDTYATYEFSKKKRQGLVKGKNFYFLWKFKSIKKISSNLKPVLRVPKDFRVIVITF